MKKAQRLGDVCRLLDLQPYVLRYWETEFPMLRAEEGGGANRVYGEAEIALLRRIKALLYEEGYTIAGAKKKLESEPHPPAGRVGIRDPAPLFADESAEEAVEVADAPDPEPAELLGSIDSTEPIEETPVEEAPIEAAPASRRLDSANDERIETLRRGVAQALEEARAILALLQPRNK